MRFVVLGEENGWRPLIFPPFQPASSSSFLSRSFRNIFSLIHTGMAARKEPIPRGANAK